MAIPYDHPYINHTRWCPRSWRSLFITPISRIMLDISMIDEGYKLIKGATPPAADPWSRGLERKNKGLVVSCSFVGNVCVYFPSDPAMSEADLHVLSGALAFGGTETLGAGAFRGISRSALEVAGLEREEENNKSSSSNNNKNNNKNKNKNNKNNKNNNNHKPKRKPNPKPQQEDQNAAKASGKGAAGHLKPG